MNITLLYKVNITSKSLKQWSMGWRKIYSLVAYQALESFPQREQIMKEKNSKILEHLPNIWLFSHCLKWSLICQANDLDYYRVLVWNIDTVMHVGHPCCTHKQTHDMIQDHIFWVDLLGIKMKLSRPFHHFHQLHLKY